jgi:hypothetical protein
MIVNKPIGAVKIGNKISRLTIGKEVPAVVLEYWKSTGQIEELKKFGAISEVTILNKPVYVEKEVIEKSAEKENKSESIFKNEK